MLRMESRNKFMTVLTEIRELEKIEMVRRNDKNYKLDHVVTKTQKTILSSFGLDEYSINKKMGDYMEIKRIKGLFIVLSVMALIIILICFMLPRFDFMYVSADKHWQKEKIADNYAGESGKGFKKVVQGEDGTYFVYKNKLMYMGNEDMQVKEICGLSGEIPGIFVRDNDIFLHNYNDYSIYKTNSSGMLEKFISNQGDIYFEGDYIYALNGVVFEKYDFKGRRIFKNDFIYYNSFVRDYTIFDDYIFYGYDHKANITVPNYYLFDANKIKYAKYELNFSKYYLEPEEWDSYLEGEVIPYDSYAKEIDKKVRKGEIDENIVEKDPDDYELQSIELSGRNFSEISDGYIYFLGRQKITYRDKNYKNKLEQDMYENMKNEDIDKIKYEIEEYPICRVKVEDIKKISDRDFINCETIDVPSLSKGYIDDIIVRDGKVYFTSIEDYIKDDKEYNSLHIYFIDTETNLSKEFYTMKGLFADKQRIETFVTDKYIFIYGCIDNSDNLCISRVNQDGSNPILVIDGNGDVVMKPLEAVE